MHLILCSSNELLWHMRRDNTNAETPVFSVGTPSEYKTRVEMRNLSQQAWLRDSTKRGVRLLTADSTLRTSDLDDSHLTVVEKGGVGEVAVVRVAEVVPCALCRLQDVNTSACLRHETHHICCSRVSKLPKATQHLKINVSSESFDCNLHVHLLTSAVPRFTWVTQY
jgi:hypothetical protein